MQVKNKTPKLGKTSGKKSLRIQVSWPFLGFKFCVTNKVPHGHQVQALRYLYFHLCILLMSCLIFNIISA